MKILIVEVDKINCVKINCVLGSIYVHMYNIYRQYVFRHVLLATCKSIPTALSAPTHISNAFLVVVVVVAVAVSQAVIHDFFASNAGNLLHLFPSPSPSAHYRRLHQLSSLCRPPRILCACGCAFDAAAVAFVVGNVAAINALAGPVSLFACSLFAFLLTVSIAFLFKCKNKGRSKKNQKRKSAKRQAAITTKNMNCP